VLILKEDKVVCFVTLLQVLILKEMEIQDVREVKDAKEVKEVRSATFVLDGVGNNAVDVEGLAFALDTPPPVFWEKRLQAIENKGWRPKKERQEISRGGKFLMDRGLEGAGRNGSVRFVRDNTRNHTTDLDVCQ